MEFRRKRRASVEIGLIPMIDVLLVLLFFFMVATTFRHQSDIKLDLPKASGNDAPVSSQVINLYIAANGDLKLVSGETDQASSGTQSFEDIKATLMALPPEARQWPFVINADGKASHQSVISALDMANQLGFHRFSFAIDNTAPHE